jgi:hypothetical protein
MTVDYTASPGKITAKIQTFLTEFSGVLRQTESDGAFLYRRSRAASRFACVRTPERILPVAIRHFFSGYQFPGLSGSSGTESSLPDSSVLHPQCLQANPPSEVVRFLSLLRRFRQWCPQHEQRRPVRSPSLQRGPFPRISCQDHKPNIRQLLFFHRWFFAELGENSFKVGPRFAFFAGRTQEVGRMVGRHEVDAFVLTPRSAKSGNGDIFP